MYKARQIIFYDCVKNFFLHHILWATLYILQVISDVTQLVKIHIYRMLIFTFKIRQMRMRIDAFILSVRM